MRGHINVFVSYIMLIPGMVLDKDDDEVLLDEPDDLASHVDDRGRVEIPFDDLTKSFDSADAFNDFDLLR